MSLALTVFTGRNLTYALLGLMDKRVNSSFPHLNVGTKSEQSDVIQFLLRDSLLLSNLATLNSLMPMTGFERGSNAFLKSRTLTTEAPLSIMLSVRGCSTYTTSKGFDRSVLLMRETQCKGRMTLSFFASAFQCIQNPNNMAFGYVLEVGRDLFTMACRYANMYRFLFCEKQLSINKISFDMELSSVEI